MNIGINLTSYNSGSMGGLGVYVRSLLLNFPEISKDDTFFVFCEKRHVDEFSSYKVKLIVFKDYEEKFFLQNELNYQIEINRIEVLFCPLLELQPIDVNIPSAINIPDMQHEFYPQFFSAEVLRYRRNFFAKSAQITDLVITLSQSSKKDIVRYLGVNPSKVKAIYLSVPEWFNKKADPEKSINILSKFKLTKKKFLLYPANNWPHKNHINLVEAFNIVHKSQPDIKLLLTGYKVDPKSDIFNLIKKYKLSDDVIFTGYVEDEVMPALFENASAIVFPSLFEGFGIPVLEGFLKQCPVICSNLPVLHEIAGDAALYFNPYNINQIAESIEKVLTDEVLAERLINKGMVAVKKYRSQLTASLTLRAIKDLTKKHKNKLGNFTYKKIKHWPKISVITPSFNQGKFIKRTIESVLDQNYPNLEYIVVDGGSTDDTVKILKSFNGKIKWISEKDNGQTDAINKGLKMATGEIYSYLNSDDTFVPGALTFVGAFFLRHPRVDFIQGKGRMINSKDVYIKDYHNKPGNLLSLHGECGLCQPACFWRRTITKEVGLFDKKFDYAMDYEYWVRIVKARNDIEYVPVYLGNSRDHSETKTNSKTSKVYKNIIQINKKYYHVVHKNWIIGLARYYLPLPKKIKWYKLLFYYPALIVLCSAINLIFNFRLFSRWLLIEYYDWYKKLFYALYRKSAFVRKFISIVKIISKNMKEFFLFFTTPENILVKLLKILQKIFPGLFANYGQIGILKQYEPRETTFNKLPKLIKKENKKLYLTIAIVTPSYNQGKFIEKTINSVLEQNYPNLRYFVQDGNSTDETLKVLRKFKKNIGFVSEHDNGQADAINKGFSNISGKIMGYLNSDDILLPGSLNYIDEYFQLHPEVDVVYGDRIIIDENDKEIGRWVLPPFDEKVIKKIDYIPQETLFWRRNVWDKLGYGMDKSFKFAMDWDLITRLISVGAKFKHLPYFLGAFRYHIKQKTSSQMDNYGWYEYQRVYAHTLNKSLKREEVGNAIAKYRNKSAVYAWLNAQGINI